MSVSLSGRWQESRATARRTGRAFGLALVGAAAIAAAPLAAEAKPIGTLSVAGLTSAPAPILGVTWGAQSPGALVSFSVTRTPDQASPLFFFRVLEGRHALSAQIVLDGKGSVPTTYDLKDVTLTSVSVQTDAKGQMSEMIQVNLVQLTVTTEGVSKCWDFETNMPC
jgi:hypothetical protein